MFTIKQTVEFTVWIDGLRDGTTRRRLQTRPRKLSLGIWGDAEPVGAGVSELREHFGAGWRTYAFSADR